MPVPDLTDISNFINAFWKRIYPYLITWIVFNIVSFLLLLYISVRITFSK